MSRTQIPGKQILDEAVDTVDIADNAVTDAKLNTTGVAGGSYTKVTVSTKGRVTAAENPTTLSGYGITDAVSKDLSTFPLQGTPNEVEIIRTSTEITVGLADNSVVPGTGAVTVPTGTTAQRAGTSGAIRYNTTTNVLETPIGGVWKSVVLDDDKRLRQDHVVRVGKDPALPYDFSSIAAAAAYVMGLNDPDAWLIDVGPGDYIEPEIVATGNIHISGFSEYGISVRPAGTDHPLFTLGEQATVSFLTVHDVTGPDQFAFKLYNVGDVYGVLLHKVAMYNVNNGWDIQSTTANSVVYLEYSDVTTSGDVGLRAVSQNGFSTYVNAENFYVYGDKDVSNPLVGVFLSGENTYMNIQSFGMEGIEDSVGSAFVLQDGAEMDAKGGSIFGWNVGCDLANTGAGSVANFIGAVFHSNTSWDLWSEHPDAEGTINGVARRAKVSAAASPNFTSAYADVETNAFVFTGDFYLGQNQAALTNVTDLIIETPPMGLLSGGVVTRTTGTSVSVSGGVGYTRVGGQVKRVEFAGGPLTFAPGSSPYIYIAGNGTLMTATTEPNQTTTILLARLLVGASSILQIGDIAVHISSLGNSMESMIRKTQDAVFAQGGGSAVSENATTPRGLNVTAGEYYYGSNRRTPGSFTGLTFLDGFRVGSQIALVPKTQVPNDTIADFNPTTGLKPMTAGYFAKHALYETGSGADVLFVLSHAQAEYATLEDAVKADIPIPVIAPAGTPVIAAIVVQQGNNSIEQILDIRPIHFRAGGGTVGGGSGGTSDHGNLIGLADDDHPQYLLVNGAREMIGDLDLSGNDIVNAATVNGIVITAHGARHLPNGADPLATAAPTTGLTPASTNATGVANSLARSDHTHAVTGFQPISAELTQVAAITTNGFSVHVEPNTWATRILTASDGVVVVNGDGIAGNPVFSLGNVGTAGTYQTVTTDSHGRVTAGTNQVPFTSLTGKPTTIAGYGITDAQPLDADLTALSLSGGTGFYIRTGDGTSVTRALVAPAAGLTITNPDGVANAPTFALANDLAAVEGLAANGIAVRTGTDTWAARTIVAPAAGLTISSPLTGNITFALANDLLALENLTTVGIAARTTAAGAWATRTLTTTTLAFTNPAGTAGDIGINLTTVGAAGTYTQVTTDAYGRVTAGTNPTTLAGYGITDAINISQLGVNNGVATLDSTGKLNLSQVPSIAITDSFVVANQAAMLLLNVEVGDIAIRTDQNETYILQAVPASTLSNWKKLATPTDSVQSVNGQTGAVTLSFVTSVATAQPSEGLTITGGPITSAGTLTFALANDLAALEALTSTGFAVRSAADTWIQRSIGAGIGIGVANGDGVAGGPVISLTTVGTAGTFKSVTTDAYGRITAGTNPTTLTGYGITDAQPLDSDLTALANTASTGLYIITAVGTSTTRTLTAGTGITVTNGTGIAGNPTFAITNVGTAGTYRSVTTNAQGQVTAGTNPTTLAGYGITDAINISEKGANSGLATLDSSGKLTAAQVPNIAISDTFVVASQAEQIALTAEVGDVAVRTDLSKSFILKTSPASSFANWQELLTPTDAVTSVNGQTGAVTVPSGSVTSVATAQPVAGLTVSGGPITTSGTLTFALANDLLALENLGSTGFAVRTAGDTWVQRTITVGNAGLTITNGDGIAGNPVITLPTIGSAGTYRVVTTDAYGRITAGTNPTTLSGFGIVDAQPLDADLSAIAAFSTTGIAVRTAADTWATRSITSGNLTITNPAGVAGNITVDLPATGTAGTYRSVTTDAQGRVTAGTNPTTLAGYGITDAQALDSDLTALANTATTGLYTITGVGTSATRSLVAGTGITITNPTGVAGNITINATNTSTGTVTSVGLAAPSIFSVTGSPVTAAGTLTLALATQAANTVFAGPASGAAAAPTFRAFNITELAGTAISAPVANQALIYNGTAWINNPTVVGSAAGTVGVIPSAGGTGWTLISGTRYYGDFVHNLGTTNVVVTVYNVTTNAVVIPDEVVLQDANTIRVTVVGNTRTLKVVVVANGNSIVAGGSTPSSVITAFQGVTVTAAATKLNFVGSTVVTDAGGGTTNVSIGARFTNYANSFDTPNNPDWIVNGFAPVQVDPTYNSMNVRSFSNTTEQGVGFMVTIPTGATIVNFRIRGRAATAPASANVVQWRIYYRQIPVNGPMGAWTGPLELPNMAIPANAYYQYYLQNSGLAAAGLVQGFVYQFELTRRVTGVTGGTNLAVPFYLAETTFEFA